MSTLEEQQKRQDLSTNAALIAGPLGGGNTVKNLSQVAAPNPADVIGRSVTTSDVAQFSAISAVTQHAKGQFSHLATPVPAHVVTPGPRLQTRQEATAQASLEQHNKPEPTRSSMRPA